MKPTKKQRHDIYVKMLEVYQQNECADYPIIHCGFCFVLMFGLHSNLKLRQFPELMRRKPAISTDLVNSLFWFNRDEAGYYTRQFILMAAIKDTEPNN